MKPNLEIVSGGNGDPTIFLPDTRPRVPDGVYHFKLVSYETSYMFDSPRLILTLTIIDHGEYHGIALPRYYNVLRLKGKPRKYGMFVPTKGGDFLIDYYSLVPGRQQRADRLSMSPLLNKIILAETATVTRNNRKKELPEPLWHSKVKKLIELREEIPP